MVLCFQFLILLLLGSSISGELCCFNEYTLYNDYCYRHFSSPLSNYSRALEICKKDGADLVSIHNAFENTHVSSIAGEDALIGLKYNPDKEIYQWSDGSALDYNNSDSEFMSHRYYFGDCAQIAKGKWLNAECIYDTLPFVCKTKAVDVPETPIFACPDPQTIYETPGALYSPGYPNDFDLNPISFADGCYYRLAAKNGYRIAITVEEFKLNDNNGNIIVYKNLETSEANEVARIDQRFIGAELILDSNLALLHLFGSYSGKWRIKWSIEEEPSFPTPRDVCPNANVIYTEPQTIYSPGYPEKFEIEATNDGCYYKLAAEKGDYIEIRIEEIYLERIYGVVDVYRTYRAEAEDHVVSLKNQNLGQAIKVDSDEVLIRVWDCNRGIYKISWKTFKSETCKSNWNYFNGSCYFQGTSNMTFNGAKAFCANLNSHPVYIETAEENQFLTGWLPVFPKEFWLGLQQTGTGEWRWLNNEPLTYTNWWGMEPDGCCEAPPFCGIFGFGYAPEQRGTWGDWTCSAGFVEPLCEYKANVLS